MRQYRDNIDPMDAARGTAYPFAPGTDMKIGNADLPHGFIRSIRLFCKPGVTLPAYINAAEAGQTSTGQDVCRLKFSDTYGELLGTVEMLLLCETAWTLGPILTDDGLLVGHICYSELLPPLVFRAARFANGTTQAALQLLPQCCLPWFPGKIRAVSVDGAGMTSNLDIRPGAYVHTEIDDGSDLGEPDDSDLVEPMAYSVVGAYQAPEAGSDGIRKLQMRRYVNGNKVAGNEVWVSGKHLVIKHDKLSNARVVCDGRIIRIKGVKDE